jgi:hypothetical protein
MKVEPPVRDFMPLELLHLLNNLSPLWMLPDRFPSRLPVDQMSSLLVVSLKLHPPALIKSITIEVDLPLIDPCLDHLFLIGRIEIFFELVWYFV